MTQIPAFFHRNQLRFRPLYEWAFGERIDHPETTARADAIMAVLRADSRFSLVEPAPLPTECLDAIHEPSLRTLYETAETLPEGQDLYPHVFPRQHEGDPTNLLHCGAFCFDAGTPINRHTAAAARWSAASAHAAATHLLLGSSTGTAQATDGSAEPGSPQPGAGTRATKLTYALSRPPGHHAEESTFGGYCYFNNAAVAANVLRPAGRVAILDIDFHHGNGTQNCFYDDSDVFVASIHGDPNAYFPFYCGFEKECGEGEGEGTNLNKPLAAGTRFGTYSDVLSGVLESIARFAPAHLVLSAGLDTYHADPIGNFGLTTDNFFELGQRIASLGLPVVAVQEGGYYTPDLGLNVVSLLSGLSD